MAPAADLRLLVFDERRGNREGSEVDKLLGFYPASTPTTEQSALAGLLHGLLLFSANFTQGRAWDIVETDQAVWAMLPAEPSICFAVTAAKAWLPRHVTQRNLQALLEHAHQLVRLLHGGVQALLDQDASGAAACAAVGEVLNFLGEELNSRASWAHRGLRNPLMHLGATPMLHTSLSASLAVQSLSDGLLLGGPGGSAAVAEVMVLYQSAVLWSSLPPADSAAIYSLVATAFLQPAALHLPEVPSVLNGDCWQQLSNGLVVLRCAAEGSAESARPLPLLHMSTGRQLRLLPFSEGKLLVLALLPEGGCGGDAELAQVPAALAAPARQLAAQLADEAKAGKAEGGHVPGCRYLVHDAERCSVRASPRGKVSAMSHHARALATSLADSLSQRALAPTSGAARGKDVPQLPQESNEARPQGGVDAEEEVWVKSSQDVWAVVRRDEHSQRRLLVVREKRPERTLGESLSAMDALAADFLGRGV